MSLPYFIADDPASGRLDGAEGRHAVTVKRITAGEHIALIDGRGTVAEVEVLNTSGKDRLSGTVVELKEISRPRPEVIVVQAVPKSERAELAVDLATQGGADAILPWISHRTIARWQGPKVAKNVEKWQSTAREAAKQSRRAWIPEVHDPVTTNQLAEMIQGETALVLHEDAEKKIGEVDLDVDKLFLIVGPEGGIGEDELELLGAVKVKLGPEVLRTASAAFAGLSAIGVLSRW
ncbi:16S rRNA (uracil(1498)-N(3))-methyltransferase [Corynebacterium appendicis]|uniref:16S rRNA (uracil(1498)-N(3))-methyltransferase n=1 Tax=Corynebacterium appendicis TaxID=163202 RepID=UPI00254EC087|nr:16S rRNA (uracil(1498)-N(3))-methyltransferase [Corynebacterium appendicis]MDK8625484.1 16S rRNA (uracil(1498)-N(3))-methyltransferase [Corynebacterium appendicis]